MKTKFIFFLIVVCFNLLFTVASVNASHLSGGEITYHSLGNGQYQIVATIYRDCAGIAISAPAITYISTCGGYGSATGVLINGPIDVITTCPNSPLTTCHGGLAPGMQRYDYAITVNLTACSDWRFSISLNARNAAIGCAAGAENLYVEAHLNNLNFNHDSPYFNLDPLFNCCNGNISVLDCSTNYSCDSVVYSIIAAKKDSANMIAYCVAYDSIHFMDGSALLDANNGMLTINPNSTQVAVYAVLVRQYRNGILISTIERDAVIYTQACSSINHLPQISGINGTNQYAATFPANKISCFNLFSSDSDSTQSTKMNLNTQLPNATFNTDTSFNQKGMFCWMPLITDTGSCPHCFSVIVNDNNCSMEGVRSFTYCITVVDSGFFLNANNMASKYYVTVSPNPLSKSATVAIHNASPLLHPQFILFDALGRTVMNTMMKKNELIIDGTLLPAGIYFYSIREDDRMMATGKILIIQ